MKKGLIIVIAGPSGVGKGTLIAELLKAFPRMCYSVSVTTRKPRKGDRVEKNYHFVSIGEFQRMMGEGKFLEWAEVFGNCYGTPKEWVEKTTSSGRNVILEIDVQGALQVKAKDKGAVLIFITPPSREELERRLRGRHSDDEEAIARRLKQADWELSHAKNFDHIVVNDKVEEAVKELKEIVRMEKGKLRIALA